MARGDKIIVPNNVPIPGEVYKHYKGDLYEIVLIAEHADPDELNVIYKANYPNPDFPYFSRLLSTWRDEILWKGHKVERFVKVDTSNSSS
jgi:hypothetical protein